MARILVTNWIDDETRARLAPHGDVDAPTTHDVPSPEAVLRRAAEADAMIAFMPDRVDAPFLAAAPKLKIVACALKGFDNFDVEACTKAGVWVSIVPDLLTAPTAELALGLAIGLARHVAAGDAHIRSGSFAGWRPTLYGVGLDGSIVAVLGLGALGKAIAKRLAGFGCRILGFDADPRAAADHVERCSLDAALAQADYIVAALPLGTGARHILDARRIALCKPGALLVNVGRGSTVAEPAVADALERGHLGGYAADVFEMEDWALADRPRAIEPRLLAHPQTLFTPHLGSAVARVRRAIALAAAENVLDALAGRRPRDAVNEPQRRGA